MCLDPDVAAGRGPCQRTADQPNRCAGRAAQAMAVLQRMAVLLAQAQRFSLPPLHCDTRQC